jgi:ribA/ribD-fused uncharacterized protein
MSQDHFIFFYGGPFSQWYQSTFEINGTKYNCAEQYMMAQKAILFGDTEAYAKIMKSHDPSTQKATGRRVKNFDPQKWELVCRKIVYDANIAKFSTPYLKEYLLATGDKEIVEASPVDKIWGIGLSESNPDRFDKSKWQGTNWLGIAIMEVREIFRKQNER